MMKCSDELSRNNKGIRENRRNVHNQNIYIYIYIYIYIKYKMLRISAETFAKNIIMFAT